MTREIATTGDRSGLSSSRRTAAEDRVHRPSINYWRAVRSLIGWTLLGVIAGCGIATVAVWAGFSSSHASRLSYFLVGFWGVVGLRTKSMMVFGILLYQRYADAETRLRCCHVPSCSAYAILAIQKHGAIRGSWMTWQRLRRCCPPGRVDYP